MKRVYIRVLLTLPLQAFGKILANSTGLDGQFYNETNYIREACLSPAFDDDPENMQKSDVSGFYIMWTQQELPKFIEQGSKNEIDAVGAHLFGVSNYGCLHTTGLCSEQPTCLDIGKFMGLKPETPLTKAQSDELKNRYFLSIMLAKHVQFTKLFSDALDGARDDLVDRADEIAVQFATQADAEAAVTCQFETAMIQTASVVLASVLAAGLVVISIPSGGAPEFAAAAGAGGLSSLGTVAVAEGGGAVGATEAVLATAATGATVAPPGTVITQAGLSAFALKMDAAASATAWTTFGTSATTGGIGGAGFITAGFLNNLGLFEADLPLDTYTDGKIIKTNIDNSRCGKSMGKFGNQNHLVETGIKNNIADEFKRLKDNMQKKGNQTFHNTTFLWKHGPSTLSFELADQPSWTIALALGDELRNKLHVQIRDRMEKNLIGLVLRSRQCHIKCLQLDPGQSVTDPQGIEVKPFEDPNDAAYLSTFYPEWVAAGENFSTQTIKPSLQCQFECLEQGDNGMPYFASGSLQWLRESKLDAHKLFNEAVLGHLLGYESFENMPLIHDQIPSFSLPVCISPNMVLDSTKEFDGKKNITTTRNGWIEEGFFPFHCGDFRANETAQFIRAMPPSQSVEKLKSMEDFWWYRMKDSMRFLENRPLTYYLTLCEVGKVIGFQEKWQPKWWQKWWPLYDKSFVGIDLGEDTARNCDLVQNKTENMGELEANLYFCYGMPELLNTSLTGDYFVIPPSGFKWKSAKHVCENIVKNQSWLEIGEQSPSNHLLEEENKKALGQFENEMWWLIAGDYQKQWWHWRNSSELRDVKEKYLPLFRWTPSDLTSRHVSFESLKLSPEFPPRLQGVDVPASKVSSTNQTQAPTNQTQTFATQKQASPQSSTSSSTTAMTQASTNQIQTFATQTQASPQSSSSSSTTATTFRRKEKSTKLPEKETSTKSASISTATTLVVVPKPTTLVALSKATFITPPMETPDKYTQIPAVMSIVDY